MAAIVSARRVTGREFASRFGDENESGKQPTRRTNHRPRARRQAQHCAEAYRHAKRQSCRNENGEQQTCHAATPKPAGARLDRREESGARGTRAWRTGFAKGEAWHRLTRSSPAVCRTPLYPAMPGNAPIQRVTRRELDAMLFGDETPAHGIELRDGAIVGLRVTHVKPGSLAERLGARDGDVIEAIDGRELTSYVELAEAERAVRDNTRFSVRARRHGVAMTWMIDVLGAR